MTSESGMSTYAELAELLDHLPLLCREKRRREGLSVRTAAEQMRVNYSVIGRFERGEGVHLDNARQILRWLGEVPA